MARSSGHPLTVMEYHMKHLKLAGTVPALALALSAGAASALTYDQDVTPDVIFGSGNANGGFTVDQANGVELGLRGKLRFDETNSPQNTYNSNGDGTYTFRAGAAPSGFGFDPNSPTTPIWNFEWSVNSDYEGSTGNNLDAFDYLLELDTDPGAGTTFVSPFDPINVLQADHGIGDNSTGNGGGGTGISANTITPAATADYADLIANNNVAQNSWSYEFFNSASGDPTFGFNPNALGDYLIRLTAFEKNSQTVVASTEITISAVPLPAAGWLLLTAFGGLGLAARRRRKAA